MQLTILESTADHIRAEYSCPCGCTPSVEYARGADLVEEGCCCGNYFAVGPSAVASLTAKVGFHRERETFNAPWGERLEAAWLVGPSVHGPTSEHGHDEHELGRATDPVCGMNVEPESARTNALHSSHNNVDYFFCGKGCKLDFDDDPEPYLDPSHVPNM